MIVNEVLCGYGTHRCQNRDVDARIVSQIQNQILQLDFLRFGSMCHWIRETGVDF